MRNITSSSVWPSVESAFQGSNFALRLAGGSCIERFVPNNDFTASQYGYDQNQFPYDIYSALSVYNDNVIVSGNTIRGAGSFYHGTEIGDPCSTLNKVTVQNNAVSIGGNSTTAGASLTRTMGSVNNLAITGNGGSTPNCGITVPAGSSAQLGGNTFTNVTTHTNSYTTPC